jgi:MOSC domain-containing protein YiiM
MDDLIGPGAMKALHGRGGTVFRILQGGVDRVGDPVLREPSPPASPEGAREGA